MDIGITQLMVNDFVYDPNKRPAKIVCIKADNCSEYEPIPLTEEILRKNGWGDESGGYEHFLSIDKEHDVEIHCDGDTITWMINLGEYDIMRLEYVHQLQHVLRLFNIEEEVVL